MTICWFCSAPMVWQSDFTFEDLERPDEGQLTVLKCSSCEAMAQFTIKDDEVSSCCDANIILDDICQSCKEHCDAA